MGRLKGTTIGKTLDTAISEREFNLAFTDLTGVPPRQADWQVQGVLGGTVRAAAEYVWDHWMGKWYSESGLQRVSARFARVVALSRQKEVEDGRSKR